MKPLALFFLSLSILGCVAQQSSITLPASGSTIKPNEKLLVQVVRPNSIQGSIEVGMVIGILQCQQTPCPPPSSQLGSIVFNGQYNPQLHPDKPGYAYENFTVTVPDFQSNFGTANAQLATGRFHMIGAGPAPILELNSVSLNIAFK